MRDWEKGRIVLVVLSVGLKENETQDQRGCTNKYTYKRKDEISVS